MADCLYSSETTFVLILHSPNSKAIGSVSHGLLSHNIKASRVRSLARLLKKNSDRMSVMHDLHEAQKLKI
jgi:alpha-D-ribose 1-methylphosphonate 5-triphosphate synthase subunit PhnI